MITLPCHPLGDTDKAISFSIEIIQSKSGSYSNASPPDTKANIKVTLYTHGIRIEERFVLPHCGNFKVARQAGDIFIVGRVNEIRRAISRNTLSFTEMKITGNDNERPKATGEFSISVPNYTDGYPRERGTLSKLSGSFVVYGVEEMSMIMPMAEKQILECLSAAEGECLDGARQALPNLLHSYSGLGWVQLAQDTINASA